ncbi:MAG: hypothetical protein CO032_08435, partial [Nitrosopumilales archaeon CG_4_9_14_0_2_um_filter_34_16]
SSGIDVLGSDSVLEVLELFLKNDEMLPKLANLCADFPSRDTSGMDFFLNIKLAPHMMCPVPW